MSDIFQIAGAGLHGGQMQLQAISQNAASASLPGYRRRVAAGTGFQAVLGVDTTAGAMINTGRPLDVAIETPNAYFALTDGSRTWLTRGGSFHVGADGTLLGDRDMRVVGAQGDVHVDTGAVQVSADGRITAQGELVGALQLFRVSRSVDFAPGEGALLLSPEEPIPVEGGRMRAGMLEASNTDASKEMLGVITLSRQFESLTRVMQGYDEMLGRTIEKIADL